MVIIMLICMNFPLKRLYKILKNVSTNVSSEHVRVTKAIENNKTLLKFISFFFLFGSNLNYNSEHHFTYCSNKRNIFYLQNFALESLINSQFNSTQLSEEL